VAIALHGTTRSKNMQTQSMPIANINPELVKNGRPVPFKMFCELTGAEDTREGRKLARFAYGKLQKEFSGQANAALGAALGSGKYAVAKFSVGTYADGRRKITAILAEPKQERQKQGLKAENDALRQKLAELEARLAQAAK
jgi:hypothetical protein